MEGDVADPGNPPPGCLFHPRCRYVAGYLQNRNSAELKEYPARSLRVLSLCG